MSFLSTGTRLPALITDGAAWAAFNHIQLLPWDLRITNYSPLTLDVEHDFRFQICLDGADKFDFKQQARAYMAMRVYEIAASFRESRLNVLGYKLEEIQSCPATEVEALRRLRGAVISSLRADLQAYLYLRPEAWATRLRAELVLLPPDVAREVVRFTGLDQELTPKEADSGLNYVFSTMAAEVLQQNGALTLTGHERKLREARAARHHPDRKARARNLAVRAVEARLSNVAQAAGPEDTSDLLSAIKADLGRRIVEDGCWGLIDATVLRDRANEGTTLPNGLPTVVEDLVLQQDRRIRDAVSRHA